MAFRSRDREGVPMGLAFVGRTSWSAADLPVSLPRPTDCNKNRFPPFMEPISYPVFQRSGILEGWG